MGIGLGLGVADGTGTACGDGTEGGMDCCDGVGVGTVAPLLLGGLEGGSEGREGAAGD